MSSPPAVVPAVPPPLRVLVIEDEADARANLCDILALDGCLVTPCGSLDDGLRALQGSEFDFVVLDRRLPDGYAEAVLPRIRELASGAGVVIVTGYADLDSVIVALREGADDYLIKPINAELLRQRLRQLSERRQLAESSRRSELAFRTLVESAGCMILTLRSGRRIDFFNAFAEEVTGFSAADARGRDFFELLVPDEDRRRCSDVFDCVRQGAMLRNYRTLLCRRDGSRAEVLWNARLLEQSPGETVTLAVGQDITSLAEAQQRALQAERLAAVGQMVVGLAHESRNALQRSQACLEMLEIEIEQNPAAQDLVRRMQKAQDQLTTLFNEVRGYVAPIQLELGDYALEEIWREAWDSLAVQRQGRSVTFREFVGVASPRCRVDHFRMVQVFRNLLENALAACRDPSEIQIVCHRTIWRGSDALLVAIRDNGPGLNAEQRARIFEPFYTTKTHGTGLGMPIAKRIVEAHGGDLTVGTEWSHGAEIVLMLPRNRA